MRHSFVCALFPSNTQLTQALPINDVSPITLHFCPCSAPASDPLRAMNARPNLIPSEPNRRSHALSSYDLYTSVDTLCRWHETHQATGLECLIPRVAHKRTGMPSMRMSHTRHLGRKCPTILISIHAQSAASNCTTHLTLQTAPPILENPCPQGLP